MSAQLCVLYLESVPPALIGSISRWLVEVAAGLWVGRPSPKVREFLWGRVVEHAECGTAVLAVADNSELGAEIRIHGSHDRTLIDLDGLVLTARLPRPT